MINFLKKLVVGGAPKLLDKLESNSKKVPITPLSLFNKMTTDELKWIFMNCETLDNSFRELVPSLPPAQLQANWTGVSGEPCLQPARHFVDIIYDYSRKFASKIDVRTRILDFGCGWGRMIRFFLADVNHENLFGIDCYPEALKAATKHNQWCNFKLSNTMPPTDFKEESFDIIFLYSVFSHLSEEAHSKWVSEFYRLLKPNGLLIATTRPRQFISICKELRLKAELEQFQTGSAQSFSDVEAAFRDYDEGKFCFSGTGGGGPLDKSFYGESCISKKYVELNWTDKFTLLDYRAADERVDQNIICCAKT